jgi:hypothetical protein
VVSVEEHYLLLNDNKKGEIIMTTETTKTCTTCGVDKPLCEYGNQKKGRLGKQSSCKVCKSEKDRLYRIEKGQELLDKKKIYYENNKEIVSERAKEYRVKNKEELSERAKRYRENNAEQQKQKHKEYYQQNRERIKEKATLYYQENKDACIERNNRYERERRQTDPIFKLLLNTKGSVYKALKREKGGKHGSKTLDSLPFTIEQLKEHLESQFDENMNWDNYGSYWHVDHIYPLKALPYDNLDHPHFRLVWDLNNLRPLGAKENMSKGDEIPENIPEHIKNYLENEKK